MRDLVTWATAGSSAGTPEAGDDCRCHCEESAASNSSSDGKRHEVFALMRASELELEAADSSESTSATIASKEFQGEFTEYGVRLDSGVLIRVRRRAANGLSEGQRVKVRARNNSEVIVFLN